MKTRQIILLSCGGILLLVFLWVIFRGQNSELSKLCDMLREYGYNYIPEDITVLYDEESTTIADVLELEPAELHEVVAASSAAGFPSKIDETGSVTLLAAGKDDSKIIFMYMLNGEPNLCFVQGTDGSITPLGEEGE